MEAISFIGISICITVIITAIFTMLAPNSKLDKVLKFAISLFFIISIVSPFLNNKINFYVDLSNIDTTYRGAILENKIEDEFIGLAVKNLEIALKKQLELDEIFAEEILISTNKNKDNSISISKVLVYVKGKDEKAKTPIEGTVKNLTGVTPQIMLLQ